MVQNKRPLSWQEYLLHYGKLAYATGQELKFAVNKRYGQRKWRIYLTRITEHGEDEIIEED